MIKKEELINNGWEYSDEKWVDFESMQDINETWTKK